MLSLNGLDADKGGREMGSLFNRLRSIGRVLAITGILFWQLLIVWPFRIMTSSGEKKKKLLGRSFAPERLRTSAPEIAKETLQKLGPTYIKFGQFMSIRPDLIPPDFCAAFKELQDRIPPFPFEQVKRELNRELGRDYTEVFSEFDEKPLAAASIAQVHSARLATGEAVAVKVQRPGIREAMGSDIVIMAGVANFVERFVPPLRIHELGQLVSEFARWTDRELYFRQEGKNALHFSCNLRDEPNVRIPRVFREYTTRKVLVMEQIDGVSIFHAAEQDIDRKHVAGLIVDSMLKQIFIDGFFHGDPHAGNILVVDRDSIAYLDFGIVGYLSEDLRAWIFDILYGMSRGDVERVIGSFLELCNVQEEEIDLAGYRRDMNEILSELPIYEAAGIPFSEMMKRFLYTSLGYRIKIPHEFILVTKALTTFEGTCLTLDPEITIVKHLRTFVGKHVARVPAPDEVLDRIKAAAFEAERIKRLVFKHGARVVKFLENPIIRIEEQASGAQGSEGAGLASGIVIAGLVLFAAFVTRENELDQWLRSSLSLPSVPLLQLASLGTAAALWQRMMRGRKAGKDRKKRGKMKAWGVS